MTVPKLNAQTLPWPTDWQTLFGPLPGAPRPLILEIGFGRGAFLLHLARSHPHSNVIGIEIASRCLTSVEQVLADQQIANARVVYAMAETALHHLFEPAALAQIHINFPDPWFKKGHAHRRLMQRDTLDAMVSRLQPGGLLYLATDIVAYAEMSRDLLEATPGLTNRLPTPWVHQLDGRVTTKYESKAREERRPCHYFAYTRNDHPAPDVPVQKDLPMPHLVFQSPLPLEAFYERYPEWTPQHMIDGAHIAFTYAFRNDNVMLVEVYLKEPTIEQHLALNLMRRPTPGEYTLKVSTIGHPRPTPAVHRAVSLFGAWLVSLHPDNHVLQDKTGDSE